MAESQVNACITSRLLHTFFGSHSLLSADLGQVSLKRTLYLISLSPTTTEGFSAGCQVH